MNKRVGLLLVLSLLMLLIRCSSVQLATNLDRGIDFSRYATFNFSQDIGQISLSELNKVSLKNAILTQMKAQGYVLSDHPILLVNALIKTTPRAHATESTYQIGLPSGYFGLNSFEKYISVEKYPEGTLFIELFDTELHKMVWEGIAERLINPRSPLTPNKINKVIKNLFRNFPH